MNAQEALAEVRGWLLALCAITDTLEGEPAPISISFPLRSLRSPIERMVKRLAPDGDLGRALSPRKADWQGWFYDIGTIDGTITHAKFREGLAPPTGSNGLPLTDAVPVLIVEVP